MKTKDVKALYDEFILPTYTQSPVCLVRGKGSKVWDIEGKEYLDFFPGWAVSGLGHCHPVVVNAVKDQAKKIIHISNNFYNLSQARLAKAISENSFPSKVFFCNSGAESVEAAIKFARKYGSEDGRFEIITMKHSFHGRTLAAITATGQPKYHKGFEPLPEGFKYADFNDLASLEGLLTDRTVAIMLELVQGEGGVNIATKEFVEGINDICKKRNILLIFDEVQTGMGRTGEMFAYKHYGIEPDLMTLAKSLGSGVPIGALVVNNKVKNALVAGTHASTYGGNPLVSRAALAVFEAIKKEKLLENTKKMGEYLGNKLEELKARHSLIKNIKRIGLMCGIELAKPGKDIAAGCMENGLLINCTQESILRVMPAMTVTKKQIDKAIKILNKVLESQNES